MTGFPMQEHLFQRIREKLPTEASLSEKIAELLCISNDSAYRRIRSETPLVLDEAKILCETFGISLDQVMEVSENTICFSSVSVNAKEYSFDKYLQDILKKVKKLASIGDAEIIYLSKDISLFHNFYFKPLFAFRYFFWMKSIIQDPTFRNKKFSIDMLPAQTEQSGKELVQFYGRVPSIEIWNTECVNSIISQIEYYREAGFITSLQDLKSIYESLESTIHHLKAQAEEGAKFLPGENSSAKKQNFQMFQNRVMLGDNTILVNAGKQRSVYLNYELLNYMVTHDVVFCENIHRNIKDLMKRSTMLSVSNEKQRNMFFNVLLRKIPSVQKLVLK
jgi:hypothetical protein